MRQSFQFLSCLLRFLGRSTVVVFPRFFSMMRNSYCAKRFPDRILKSENLSPQKSMKCRNEEKIIKAAALRGAIAALNTGLITANLALSKVVGQSGLTADQNLSVGSLLTKN